MSNEDYDLVAEYRWHLDKGYATHTVNIKGKFHVVRMHRLIMGVTDPAVFIDHRDGHRRNNQRSNLRRSNHSLNRQNVTLYGVSKFRGVSWRADRQHWKATATLNKKFHYIGSYRTQTAAARAAAKWRSENMPHSKEASHGK